MSCFDITGEYFCQKLIEAMGQIIMTVEAINWTEGNVGHVCIRLNGGSCQINWGDGHTSNCRTSLPKEQAEWLYYLHAYPNNCKAAKKRFDILISSDSDNITGIIADSGEMNIVDIDMRGCQSLVYFEASYLIDHFDLTTNPGIQYMNLKGEACGLADFSNSTELKELYFSNPIGRKNEAVKILDLTKCDKLEYLKCDLAYELTHIAISNRSALKKLIYDADMPLSDKSIKIIKRIIERNGGEIVELDGNYEYKQRGNKNNKRKNG